MFHEQSRPDRDDYVSINWNNIDPGKSNIPSNAFENFFFSAQKFNFDKYTNDEVDTQMTSYDYGSVMHYDRYAFALNRTQPTITPTMNASAFIGQRAGLSLTDIIEIQRFYDCIPMSTTSTSTTTTTDNPNAYTKSVRNNFSHSVLQSSPSFVVFLLLLLRHH